MKADWREEGVYLLYDGECPMCSTVATAVRLKREFGALHLLDARTSQDHPLYLEVCRRQLNLDEGMVVLARGEFFHGAEAVQLIARTSDGSNLTSLSARTLFKSGWLTRLCYPALRSIRNRLLKHKKVQQIDNLGLRERK